jgi:hypothetical protein
MSISNENLPKSMRYGLHGATAVQAETTLARFSSVNGTSFSPTGSNEIRIRVSANGFLQSEKHYLEFKVTTATADAQVDTHAGSFFDRVTIEQNGAILEQINSYALYNSIRQNYNNDLNELYKKECGSGAAGLAVEFTPTQIGLAAADTAAAVKTVTDAAFTADNGKLFALDRSAAGAFITSGHSKLFAIQLESGLLLNHHKKCLPDSMNEIEIILRLAPSTAAMVSAGAATYTIDNPVLYCPVMNVLNAEVMSSYRSVVGQEGVMISGTTAKTYINAVPLAAGTKTLQINDRSISCLGLVTALQVATASSTNNVYSVGAYGYTDTTATDKITSFKHVIQGSNYPQSDIKVSVASNGLNLGRAQEETCKALAKHGEDYCKSMISIQTLTQQFDGTYAASPGTNGVNIPRGLFSVDLKKMSDNGLRMVGLNTASNSSPSVLELDCTVALAAACTATTFSIVEAFYQMDSLGGFNVAM